MNLRKVRPVYMKVKSKCQSFSKLDITFDSLVLGEHFVEQLFGPGCPAYCGEQPIDTHVKKSSKSFLDYYSSKKKLNWTDKVQLNRRPTGKGFRPLNRSGSVVVCAQESCEVEKQVIFLRVPSCATSLCRKSDYSVRKLGGLYNYNNILAYNPPSG